MTTTTTTTTQTAAPNWGKGVMSTVAGHSRPVNTLAWNSEGKLLASGSDDKTALVFSVSSAQQPKQTAKLDGHGDSVVQLCWEPNAASNLATLAADRTVRLWDVRTRNGPTASIKVNHEYINCSWSGDGRTIAVGSSVGAKDDNVKDCVSLIDARTLRVMKLLKFPYEVNEFCWSPDSSHLLLTTEHGTVEVLCTDGEKKSMNAATLKAHTDDCYCVALDAGTSTLAVGSKDSLVSIWDLYECACLRTIAR
jgi:THO complex subunit 3